MTARSAGAIDGVVALFLAAGKGVRLGGPKALLLVEGAPLIEVQCRERLANESARAVAVLRADVAALVRGRLEGIGAEIVVSEEDDALGPAGSLAAGVRYLGERGFFAAVVSPVDVRVAASTVRRLVEVVAEGGGEGPLAAVPRWRGRRGHPVVVRAEGLARYARGEAAPLRDHLRALGERVAAVDVEDVYTSEDLDLPSQVDALRRITGAEAPRFFEG